MLLTKLGLDSKDSMQLYCDNKVAISIAHNPIQHDRTKYVEIEWHFIKEKHQEGIICTPYVKTGEQLEDMLTKGVSSSILHSALSKMGMRDIYASTWGEVLKMETIDILWFSIIYFDCNIVFISFHISL
jgi:hypothetical protein